MLLLYESNHANYYNIRNIFINSNFFLEKINLQNIKINSLSHFLVTNYIIQTPKKENEYHFEVSKSIKVPAFISSIKLNDELIVLGTHNNFFYVINIKNYKIELEIDEFKGTLISLYALDNNKFVFISKSSNNIDMIKIDSLNQTYIHEYTYSIKACSSLKLSKNRVLFNLQGGGICIYNSNAPYNYLYSSNFHSWKNDVHSLQLNGKETLLTTENDILIFLNLNTYKKELHQIGYSIFQQFSENKVILLHKYQISIFNIDSLQAETDFIDNVYPTANLFMPLRNEGVLFSNNNGRKFYITDKIEINLLSFNSKQGKITELISISETMFIECIVDGDLKFWIY